MAAAAVAAAVALWCPVRSGPRSQGRRVPPLCLPSRPPPCPLRLLLTRLLLESQLLIAVRLVRQWVLALPPGVLPVPPAGAVGEGAMVVAR